MMAPLFVASAHRSLRPLPRSLAHQGKPQQQVFKSDCEMAAGMMWNDCVNREQSSLKIQNNLGLISPLLGTAKGAGRIFR
jgi:hypothetical protein